MIHHFHDDKDLAIYGNDSDEVKEQKNRLGMERYPEHKAQFLHSLFWFYLNTANQQDKALECIMQAIECCTENENLGEYYYCLSMHYGEQENYPLAIEALQKAVEADPNCIDW